jgi:hypothetical protein
MVNCVCPDKVSLIKKWQTCRWNNSKQLPMWAESWFLEHETFSSILAVDLPSLDVEVAIGNCCVPSHIMEKVRHSLW